MAATTMVEAATKIKNPGSPLLKLSVQEIIDCDKYSNGCTSGFVHDAFRYIIRSEGINKESDYPPYSASK